MNHKRIERLWRREGLKVPREQPKRRQLWLNDGSCVPLRPLHKDHNVGTVLMQFAIVLIIFILANRWIVKKTIGGPRDAA